MSRIVLPSPAKLNLFLKVQNKREDGFHNIVTVFERINLADEISFQSTADKSIRITCDHPQVPVGSKNLVHKVAKLFQEELGINRGAQIRIKKRIPVAAGLAGGSSNAATALLGLNQIWKLDLSRTKLLEYARRIGSDVAFFMYDTSWALGRGRGDQIKSLNIKTKLWHILIIPCIKMYSWRVYGGLKAPKRASTNVLTKINDNANILIHNLKKGNILDTGKAISNDLEAEIIRLCPRLKTLKERLKSLNPKGVMISGSGPSVFGLTATEDEAALIQSVLLKRFSRVFVVRTL